MGKINKYKKLGKRQVSLNSQQLCCYIENVYEILFYGNPFQHKSKDLIKIVLHV